MAFEWLLVLCRCVSISNTIVSFPQWVIAYMGNELVCCLMWFTASSQGNGLQKSEPITIFLMRWADTPSRFIPSHGRRFFWHSTIVGCGTWGLSWQKTVTWDSKCMSVSCPQLCRSEMSTTFQTALCCVEWWRACRYPSRIPFELIHWYRPPIVGIWDGSSDIWEGCFFLFFLMIFYLLLLEIKK